MLRNAWDLRPPWRSHMLWPTCCLFELRHSCSGVLAKSAGGQDISVSTREYLCGQFSNTPLAPTSFKTALQPDSDASVVRTLRW